jgi:hypothetical protein
MKLVELELENQSNSIPIIVIPLDFLTILNIQNRSNTAVSKGTQNGDSQTGTQ